MRAHLVGRSLSSAVALAVIGGVPAARADADALLDTLGPRELAVGGAGRGAATGGMGVTLNPSGIPLNRELVFEGGYGYRPEDGQSAVGVTACDSTNAMPGCFFYNYVGASPDIGGMAYARRAHTAGLALSRMISPQLTVGVTGKYFDYNSDLMGEADASGFTVDVGATGRVSELFSIGATGYNLFGADSVNFPRAVGGGAVARLVPQLALTFDGLWDLDADDTSGRYGGGAEYFVSARRGQVGLPLRVGGAYDSAGDGRTFITGGIGLTTMKVGFDIGAQREVRGGDELLVTASLRFFGPRIEAGALQ